jgi:hypothetical protein
LAHQIVGINNTSNGAILGLFHGFTSNYKEKKHNEISACRGCWCSPTKWAIITILRDVLGRKYFYDQAVN